MYICTHILKESNRSVFAIALARCTHSQILWVSVFCWVFFLHSDRCGNLSDYANKWRPDADGCEANADNKSVLSLQMTHATLPSSPPPPPPACVSSPPPLPPSLPPPPPPTTMQPLPSVSPIPNTVSQVCELHAGVGVMEPSVQVSVSATRSQETGLPQVTPAATATSASVQNGPAKHTFSFSSQSSAPYPPPVCPPSPFPYTFSPPSSPGPSVLHKARRQSLQEHLLHQPTTSSVTPHDFSSTASPLPPPPMTTTHLTSLPLCGLPTHPPESTPVGGGHSEQLQQQKPVLARAATSPNSPTQTEVDFNASVAGTCSEATVPVQSARRSPHWGHTRSKSSGTIFLPSPNAEACTPAPRPRQHSHSRHCSAGNVLPGIVTNLKGVEKLVPETSFSPTPNFTFDSAALQRPASPPNPEKGYDFAKHFNLFSPFTSNMALEYCQQREGPREPPECSAPPVWCMDVWDSFVAVGCGNGQIEVSVCLC